MRRAWHTTPFVVMALMTLGGIWLLASRWGEVRAVEGSVWDLIGAALWLTAFVQMMWRRSTSPLRTYVATFLIANTWWDALVLSPMSPIEPQVIGLGHLVIETLWLGSIALLYFDRPTPQYVLTITTLENR